MLKDQKQEETPVTAAGDEELFRELNAQKTKKKRRTVRTVIIAAVVAAAAIAVGVFALRGKVRREYVAKQDDVSAYAATVGSISTTVSGSGQLSYEDTEDITVPDGVEIKEVTVSANTSVKAGDVLAKVDVISVKNAMATVQSEIKSLDEDIADAASDTADTYITAGVNGRLKKIYAQNGDSVVSCMAENGALAVLSLDGYMQTEVETDALSAGDAVTVIRAEGKELPGTVESAGAGKAVILVTDNGPELDETVTVKTEDGTELGQGTLSIHSCLRITGFAGTVTSAAVRENTAVTAAATLFYLKDTAYSARCDALLQERAELEDTMMELVKLYETGALVAPCDGVVSAVLYDEDVGITEGDATEIVTLAPSSTMSVTLSVDETDILSLAVGQTAQITVSSIGDGTYEGTVTEIDKSAVSASGVTSYSTVITLERADGMLPGMTAKAVIRIQGVDKAILIPIEALHQTSSNAYVYTSYNEDTGEYGGMVEVTTGIANSNYVEITSGLKEGDTVYYTEEKNTFSFADRSGGRNRDEEMDFAFGEADMPGRDFGGGRPDFGGERPAGDFGGGMPGGRG